MSRDRLTRACGIEPLQGDDLPEHRARRSFLLGVTGLATAALLPKARARDRHAQATDPAEDLRIQRLAWAGVRLQLPNATLFIDPLVDTQAWGDKLKDPLVPVAEPQGNAYVLITHAHGDHFDPRAVADALAEGGALVHPAGTHPLPLPPRARAWASEAWEPQLLGDFTATAVPASDGYGDPQMSWVVSAGGRRIFHGGDTLWHGHWWKIARQFGPFDAAFLPVNGARFGWRKPVSGQPGVLSPQQAVAAASVLGARRLVPIHYGVSGMDEYVEVADPIGELRRALRGNEVKLQVLEPGEWLDWSS